MSYVTTPYLLVLDPPMLVEKYRGQGCRRAIWSIA